MNGYLSSYINIPPKYTVVPTSSTFYFPVSTFYLKGLARTQIPTNINYAIEFPTFGEIAGVNPTEVQWKGLALEEPPS